MSFLNPRGLCNAPTSFVQYAVQSLLCLFAITLTADGLSISGTVWVRHAFHVGLSDPARWFVLGGIVLLWVLAVIYLARILVVMTIRFARWKWSGVRR
jgi:hypothetical protein